MNTGMLADQSLLAAQGALLPMKQTARQGPRHRNESRSRTFEVYLYPDEGNEGADTTSASHQYSSGEDLDQT